MSVGGVSQLAVGGDMGELSVAVHTGRLLGEDVAGVVVVNSGAGNAPARQRALPAARLLGGRRGADEPALGGGSSAEGTRRAGGGAHDGA